MQCSCTQLLSVINRKIISFSDYVTGNTKLYKIHFSSSTLSLTFSLFMNSLHCTSTFDGDHSIIMRNPYLSWSVEGFRTPFINVWSVFRHFLLRFLWQRKIYSSFILFKLLKSPGCHQWNNSLSISLTRARAAYVISSLIVKEIILIQIYVQSLTL